MSPERRAYLRQLFVHGLLESLTDETTGAARGLRDRRVGAVMASIRAAPPAGHVHMARPPLGWRRWRRGLAAAAAVLLIVAGALAIFSGGGLEARAAVRSALVRVDDGMDRMYRGKLTLVFASGEERVERALRAEFHSRGRDRFYGVLEVPLGGLGAVPVHFGRVGEAIWVDFGLGAQRFEPGGMPMPMPLAGDANPFDSVTNLGSLLEMMDERCDLEWEEVGGSGAPRIVGTPARGREMSLRSLRRVLVELDPDNHDVRSIQAEITPAENEPGPAGMMFGLPRDARLRAVIARLELVKCYRAKDTVYWPAELGDPEDDG